MEYIIPGGIALEYGAGAGAGAGAADVEHGRLWQHADGTQIGKPGYAEPWSGTCGFMVLNASGEMLQVVAMLARFSPWPRLWVLLPLSTQAPEEACH